MSPIQTLIAVTLSNDASGHSLQLTDAARAEHAALVAVAVAATNCNISWNVGTVTHLKNMLAVLAAVRGGKAQ